MPTAVPELMNLPTPVSTAKPASSASASQADAQQSSSFQDTLQKAKNKDSPQGAESKAQAPKPRTGKQGADSAKKAGKPTDPAQAKQKIKSTESSEDDAGDDPADQASQQQQPQDEPPRKSQRAQKLEPVDQPPVADQLPVALQTQTPTAQDKSADRASEKTVTPSAPPSVHAVKPENVKSEPDDSAASAPGDAPKASPSASDQNPEPEVPSPLMDAKPGKVSRPNVGVVKQAAPDPPDSVPDNSVAASSVQLPDDPSDLDASPQPAAVFDVDPQSFLKTAPKSSDEQSTASADLAEPSSASQAPKEPLHISAAAPAAIPETRFAEANVAKIVSGVHGQLLPNGGTMQIRLDPPELGALHVKVEMRDGVMTASFETSNPEATKLLSHSLSDLKTALESQGVSVERLHVHQNTRPEAHADSRQGDRDASQDQSARREQQRREMVRRLWRRLGRQEDPLDLVA